MTEISIENPCVSCTGAQSCKRELDKWQSLERMARYGMGFGGGDFEDDSVTRATFQKFRVEAVRPFRDDPSLLDVLISSCEFVDDPANCPNSDRLQAAADTVAAVLKKPLVEFIPSPTE